MNVVTDSIAMTRDIILVKLLYLFKIWRVSDKIFSFSDKKENWHLKKKKKKMQTNKLNMIFRSKNYYVKNHKNKIRKKRSFNKI